MLEVNQNMADAPPEGTDGTAGHQLFTCINHLLMQMTMKVM